MGGKALKNVNTRRFDKLEFDKLWIDLKTLLEDFIEPNSFDLVRSYHNKPDHGDMDILVKTSKNWTQENQLEEIIRAIQPNEVHKNASIVSMDWLNCQIDLMFIPEDKYDLCWHFFAYNDLGGFMGKIARSMKCQYGQKGLTFKIYSEDGSRLLEKISLSKDPKEIFEFLGFNYYRFVRGFDELHEIFEYVADSEFFRLATFDGSELNSSQKSRDMTRPNYEKMLQYFDQFLAPIDKITERPNLEFCSKRIDEFFCEKNIWISDGIMNRIEELRYYDKLKQEAKAKFNGSHIMSRYNLPGSPLIGQLMANYEEGEEELFLIILNQSMDEIWEHFEMVNKKLLEENGIKI